MPSEEIGKGTEQQAPQPAPAPASSRSQAWTLKAVAAGIVAAAIGVNLWLANSFTRPGWTVYGSKPIDWNSRRQEVEDAFISSWDAYSKYAWGQLLIIYTYEGQSRSQLSLMEC
jgi:mannosyl-oligosaccharide alpha-1,2-mannosidase